MGGNRRICAMRRMNMDGGAEYEYSIAIAYI